ncbi:hypothetical protein BV898_18711 [Hypsibius exemplaris]|uniref:Glycoside hydrolase family 19 catalytic domain-containing protein n=1 Tax=Hypsibius exemplaris TaxID=2072580 RepID=A0A9X6RNE6_HYPEX|nr:hypothetical protein BV898_18711 [Hypsibius exemplaris]
MFLAQVVHESAGLRVKEEFGKGASKSYENCCDSVHSDRSLWVERCNPTGKRGVSYHGRGYLQLTHCYNYHAASLALFGNAYTLLENPDFVLEEGIAWRTAFWFWKTIVRTDARKNDIKAGKFGVTTAAINGMECTNPDLKKIAQKRFKYYKNVSEALKLKPSTNAETGCYKC